MVENLQNNGQKSVAPQPPTRPTPPVTSSPVQKAKGSTPTPEGFAQTSQKKKISFATLTSASKTYIEEEEKKEEERKKQDAARAENYYVGMRDGNRTEVNILPLPFLNVGTQSYNLSRTFNHATQVVFDTLEKNDQGTGTKKKYFQVLPSEGFIQYEQMTGTKVISDEDKELIDDVTIRLKRLFKYYPFFDKVGKGTKVDLPDSFMSLYRNRLKLNYIPNYMVVPAILLSEVYTGSDGAEVNKVHNKFVVLHFNKSKLIMDWNNKILEFSQMSDPAAQLKAEEVMNGPDIGNCKYYLSFSVDKIKASVDDTSAAKPDRLVEFKIEEFIPQLFKVSGKAIELTEDLLNKSFDLYNKEGWYRVAVFERESYKDLQNILVTAENWLGECNVIQNGNPVPVAQGNLLESVDETNSNEISVEAHSGGAIQDDEVPF